MFYQHSYGGASDAGSSSAHGSGYTAAAADFVSEVFFGAARVARRAQMSVRAHIRKRRAVKTLSSLDDRTLKDIGVSRLEIMPLAHRFSNVEGVDYRVLASGR